jgi:hypothetical protein
LFVVKRNPQPATFFENHFLNVGGVGGYKKDRFTFGEPAFFCIQIIYVAYKI